ncbi:MAG: GA module-containing protein [Peptoniphilus sp. oral taxon 375]|nr:GA module-containing protein [Peptoniphilus sp. oral taxon 375]
MSKRRKIAGTLSAIVLLSSFPSPLLAAQDLTKPQNLTLQPTSAELEEANHSNVLQAQTMRTTYSQKNNAFNQDKNASQGTEIDESDVIKDPVLKKVINVELGRDESTKVTKEDLESEGLEDIDVNYYDPGDVIKDLSGLEYAKNLESLNLFYKGTDLSILKNLPQLEFLNIVGTAKPDRDEKGKTPVEKIEAQLSDGQSDLKSLDFIGSLPNLEQLFIQNTKVSNLEPLKNLTKLCKLGLDCNEISSEDLEPLTQIQSVTKWNRKTFLFLNGNRISDFSNLNVDKTKFTMFENCCQRPIIKPANEIFENPCKDKQGNYFELKSENLEEVTPQEDDSITKIHQKYRLVNIEGKNEINVSFAHEIEKNTLTIDLSELHKKEEEATKAKELAEVKETAKTAINGLDKLSDNEKLDFVSKVNAATDKEAVEKLVEEAKKQNNAKDRKPISIHVSGYAGRTYIQNIYNADIQITNKNKDGDPGEKMDQTGLFWKLSPGTYSVTISCDGFDDLTQEVNIDKTTPYLEFHLEKSQKQDQGDKKQYPQPSIQKIQLVEFGNPDIVLANGSINGNLISFVVENEQYRERAFNEKATIKLIDPVNTHAYSTYSHTVPSRFKKRYDYHPTSGDVKALSGNSEEPIIFNPDGTTSLFIKGKGGLVSEYAMFVKAKTNQHVVLFQAPNDDGGELGLMYLNWKEPSGQGGRQCSELVQVVEDGKTFVEPFKWVADTTELKAGWFSHKLGKFLGWYDERYGGKKYDETTPITEDTILYARFEKSTKPTDFSEPFTVWIPGNVDVFKAPLKVSWSVNGTDLKELTEPKDVKVGKGDTLDLKIDDSASEWKLSGMEARYGLLKLPIEKDDQGVYHLKPIPSHDNTGLYPDNNIYLSWVKSEDAGNKAFDLNKQHTIHLLQEGTKVEFINIKECEDFKTDHELLSKFQEGHTIRFQVRGEKIDKVDAQDQTGNPVVLNTDSETKDEKTGLITRNYSFVMPADDVDLIVKGTYKQKLAKRRVDFHFKDSKENEVSKEKIKSLTIIGGGEECTFNKADLKKDTYIPVSNLGYTYHYTVVLEDGTVYQGKFDKTAKEMGDSCTIELKANSSSKEQTKESVEELVAFAKKRLEEKGYSQEAKDQLKKAIESAEEKAKKQNFNEAYNDLQSAIAKMGAPKVDEKPDPTEEVNLTKEEKNLKDLIKTIERLEEKNYSKETWKDLKYALDEAKDELNYSKRTERSLERAYDKLNKAYKDLKLADKLAQEAEKINQDHKVLVRNSSYQNMTDIKSHWARDFIKYCMDRGYLVGTSITNFSPDRPTTRAEFVTVLSRLAGIKEENYKQNKFTDVPKGVYYEAAVNWAQDKKIVEGIGNNKFAPDQTMTREEMATILDRYFQAIKKDYGNRGALYFQDQGDISLWAADSVKRMTQTGILHGTDRNTFEPKSSFTRAELATVIYQLNK